MILAPDILDCAEINLLILPSSLRLSRALNDLVYSSFDFLHSLIVQLSSQDLPARNQIHDYSCSPWLFVRRPVGKRTCLPRSPAMQARSPLMLWVNSLSLLGFPAEDAIPAMPE